jgi:hypothetical protein
MEERGVELTRIVHIQTTIQTVFGVLDDEGNVTPQQPVVVQVGRFAPEAFAEAFATVADARDRAAVGIESSETTSPARSGGTDENQRP